MFVVIFEVLPTDGRRDEYLAHAKALKPVLESIDGFIDNERFESRRRPGWVLSLSTWRDEKSVIRWRTEMRHNITQGKGRGGIFADYHLRVAEVTADDAPPVGHPVREQRFDATETGLAKACTIAEIDPLEGRTLPKGQDGVTRALRLDPTTAGLVDHDVFDSIYRPGKALLLASWEGPGEAGAFRPAAPPESERMRLRAVRVIRDYGMFDRRETPQYHPDVQRAG